MQAAATASRIRDASPSRRVARAAALLVLLAASALVPPIAAAQEGPVIEWTYRISIPEPASGNARVELTIAGAAGIVSAYTFSWTPEREARNVTGGPATPLRLDGSSLSFDVDGVESFRYDVRVEQDAFREGERLNHVGEDFAVFKADVAQLAYRYSYLEGAAWTVRASVALEAPDGWEARGPWASSPDGGHALPEGEVFPRGFVVFGAFQAERTFEAAGKTFRYVRLGSPGVFEADMEAYLRDATPYYEGVYGAGVGRDVLIVNAPSPMFHGGLGATDSVFLHEDVSLRTLAHEYAHVFQRFGSEESLPSTTIWLTEGDADLHSALSLVETGFWTSADLRRFLEEAREDAEDPALAGARLSEATYGGELERFAYHKGAVVLRALDDTMREATAGRVGVADLLRRLNADHDGGAADGEPARNDEVRLLASELVGFDLSEFFDRYVDGTEWPADDAFLPDARVSVRSIALDPARATPGAAIRVVLDVENAGTAEADTEILVVLDGDVVARAPARLAAGERREVVATIEAPEAGTHVVRALDATARLEVLRPARVVLTFLTYPDPVRAQEDATFRMRLENRGEVPGSANVSIEHGGLVLATAQADALAPGEEREVSLVARLAEAGDANLTFRVRSDGGTSEHSEVFVVEEAPPTAPTRTAGDPTAPPRSGERASPIPWGAPVALAAIAIASRALRTRPR